LNRGSQDRFFRPLNKKNHFKKFFIDGPTIAWSNGADIAPETPYEAVAAKTESNSKLRRAGWWMSKLKRRDPETESTNPKCP
jgi:hypothetical protein